MDWNIELTGRQRRLAIGLIAGFVILFALRLWSSGMAARMHGPQALSVAKAPVAQAWVYANETFYQLSVAGAVEARHPASAFGLEDGITDFQVLDDNHLLIGDYARQQILRCRLADNACEKLWPAQGPQLGRLFKFYLDEPRGMLFVADNWADQLLVYGLGNRQARAVTLPGELNYPNAVWMDERQTIWVADTNNHRIVGLRPGAQLTKPVYKLEADAEVGKGSHPWPVAFARDDQHQFWGLFGDGRLMNAELVRYDHNQQAVQRVAFPDGGDVVDIAYLDGHVLAADLTGFILHRVAASDGSLSVFGSPQFQQEMQDLRSGQQRYRWLSTASLVLMLVLLVPVWLLARQVSKDSTTARQEYLARHGVKIN